MLPDETPETPPSIQEAYDRLLRQAYRRGLEDGLPDNDAYRAAEARAKLSAAVGRWDDAAHKSYTLSLDPEAVRPPTRVGFTVINHQPRVMVDAIRLEHALAHMLGGPPHPHLQGITVEFQAFTGDIELSGALPLTNLELEQLTRLLDLVKDRVEKEVAADLRAVETGEPSRFNARRVLREGSGPGRLSRSVTGETAWKR